MLLYSSESDRELRPDPPGGKDSLLDGFPAGRIPCWTDAFRRRWLTQSRQHKNKAPLPCERPCYDVVGGTGRERSCRAGLHRCYLGRGSPTPTRSVPPEQRPSGLHALYKLREGGLAEVKLSPKVVVWWPSLRKTGGPQQGLRGGPVQGKVEQACAGKYGGLQELSGRPAQKWWSDRGAGVARAWRGRGAGYRAFFALGGAGVARSWRGRGAGMSCDPRRSPLPSPRPRSCIMLQTLGHGKRN
eukprot:gene7798-biopygen15113